MAIMSALKNKPYLTVVDWPLDSAPFSNHMAVLDDAHVAYNQCNLRLAATMARFPRMSCFSPSYNYRKAVFCAP